MASVWYIGHANSRLFTAADWAREGITAYESVWNAANGWSIPQSQFTSAQLDVLVEQGNFRINAPDGPRQPGSVQPTPIKTLEALIQEVQALRGALQVGFTSDIEDLTIHFGRAPLPDPEDYPNTVFVVIP